MVFVLAVTMTALVFMFRGAIAAGIWLHVIIAAALFVLAIVLVYLTITKLAAEKKQKMRASG